MSTSTSAAAPARGVQFTKVPIDLFVEPFDAVYEVTYRGDRIGRVARRRFPVRVGTRPSRPRPRCPWRAQVPSPDGGWDDLGGMHANRQNALLDLVRHSRNEAGRTVS